MVRKKEFNREAAMLYAAIQDPPLEIPPQATEEAIKRILSEYVGKTGESCGACRTKDEEHFLRPADRFCYFCGDDATEDGTGGYERVKAEMEVASGKKKVSVVDESKKEGKESKKESKKEQPKKEQPKKEPVEEEGPKKGDSKACAILKKLVAEIKGLEATTGGSAWDIGKNLFQIVHDHLYRAEGFESFDAFCGKELGYTRAYAYGFIRFSEKFKRADAEELGITRMQILSHAPEQARTKLLEAAKKPDVACSDLREKVKDATQKAREKRGETKSNRGRPRLSKFRSFLGSNWKGNYDAEKGKGLIDLDGKIGIEVTVLSKSVKVEFIEIEEEESEE